MPPPSSIGSPKSNSSQQTQQPCVLRRRSIAHVLQDQSLAQQRLAWKQVPLYLLSAGLGFALSLAIPSHFGEEGNSQARVGDNSQFSAYALPESSPPPASDAVESLTVSQSPPIESLIEPQIHRELVAPDPLPDTPMPSVDLIADTPTLFAVEEQLRPEQAAPPARRKAKPTVTQTRPQRKEASARLGASSSAAAGRISVSYKDAPPPPYPRRLRAAGKMGSVGVRIHVNASGHPTRVLITRSSGHHELDEEARAWILDNWSFNPAQEGGQPIAALVHTSIHFVRG